MVSCLFFIRFISFWRHNWENAKNLPSRVWPKKKTLGAMRLLDLHAAQTRETVQTAQGLLLSEAYPGNQTSNHLGLLVRTTHGDATIQGQQDKGTKPFISGAGGAPSATKYDCVVKVAPRKENWSHTRARAQGGRCAPKRKRLALGRGCHGRRLGRGIFLALAPCLF